MKKIGKSRRDTAEKEEKDKGWIELKLESWPVKRTPGSVSRALSVSYPGLPFILRRTDSFNIQLVTRIRDQPRATRERKLRKTRTINVTGWTKRIRSELRCVSRSPTILKSCCLSHRKRFLVYLIENVYSRLDVPSPVFFWSRRGNIQSGLINLSKLKLHTKYVEEKYFRGNHIIHSCKRTCAYYNWNLQFYVVSLGISRNRSILLYQLVPRKN